MGCTGHERRKALRHVRDDVGCSRLRLVGYEVGVAKCTRHDATIFNDTMDSGSRYCLQMLRHDAVTASLVDIGAMCHLRAWGGQTQNVQVEFEWHVQATATEEVQNTAHGDKLRTTRNPKIAKFGNFAKLPNCKIGQDHQSAH